MRLPKATFRIIRQKALQQIGRVFEKPFTQKLDSSLIIAPHPDDEVFGCGGWISRLAGSGNKVEILFLTNGSASHQGCCGEPVEHVGVRREGLAKEAAGILGVSEDSLNFLAGKDGILPHQGHDGFTDMVAKITEAIRDATPEAVFCTHPFEGWSDHVAAVELATAAIGMLPEESRPKLYYYCVWFWYSMPLRRGLRLDWRKARFLDISKQLPLKRQAIKIYLDALAPCGNPWVGKLPKGFLRAFDWDKELYFEADISTGRGIQKKQ